MYCSSKLCIVLVHEAHESAVTPEDQNKNLSYKKRDLESRYGKWQASDSQDKNLIEKIKKVRNICIG